MVSRPVGEFVVPALGKLVRRILPELFDRDLPIINIRLLIVDPPEGSQVTIIGSLLLVIGWLMMSEGSREFLGHNLTAWRTALVVIPVLAATNAMWLVDRFRVSENKVDLLDGLKYLEEGYYVSDKITPVVVVADTILHLALFTALFGLAYMPCP